MTRRVIFLRDTTGGGKLLVFERIVLDSDIPTVFVTGDDIDGKLFFLRVMPVVVATVAAGTVAAVVIS